MESTSALSNLHSHPRWEAIWKSGLEPGQGWDVMTTSPCLLKYLQEGKIPVGRALVPGCGRGYDLVALCSAERHVTGLEISPTAIQVCVEYAHAHIPSALHPQVRVLERSFFEEDGEYDFIYDYTFLCALDPSLRSDWASKMAKLVKPGGLLMTLIFPIWTNIDEQGTPLVSHLERTVVAGTPSTGPRPDGGPPFRVSLELLRELLTPVGFHCEDLGMAVRVEKDRLVVWECGDDYRFIPTL
eukprot:gene23566-28576_t